MPNKSLGRDLHIRQVILHQVGPSWYNLHHEVPTSVKLIFLSSFLSFFLSSGHLSVNDYSTLTEKNWQYDLKETSHVYSWVECGLLCKILLTSRMNLTFQGHDPVKSHFGPYLGYCRDNCQQILTQHSLVL